MKIEFDVHDRVFEAMDKVSESFDRVADLLEENPDDVEEAKKLLAETLSNLTKIVKHGFCVKH